MFLDVGVFASHGCRLSMWEMALACGRIVPMLVSTNDNNWYCRDLVTSSYLMDWCRNFRLFSLMKPNFYLWKQTLLLFFSLSPLVRS